MVFELRIFKVNNDYDYKQVFSDYFQIIEGVFIDTCYIVFNNSKVECNKDFERIFKYFIGNQ